MPPLTSTGEILERDQLQHVVGLQTARIEELQGEVQRLLDWSSDANGANVAVSSLVRIVGDSTATTGQRLRAAAAVLGYKTPDDGRFTPKDRLGATEIASSCCAMNLHRGLFRPWSGLPPRRAM